MISIRRFLERSEAPIAGDELLEASMRLRGLLSGIASAGQLSTGSESNPASELLLRLDHAAGPAEILEIANEALAATQSGVRRTVDFSEELRSQLQSVAAMLTEAIKEISGLADASLDQLEEIERQLESATNPDDIRALKGRLANCLGALKESVVKQRNATLFTLNAMQEEAQGGSQPGMAQAAPAAEKGDPAGAPEEQYVAVFRLQHSDHIVARFGETAREQMLAVIRQALEAIAATDDEIVRWKGLCFVMFLKSSNRLIFIRRRLAAAVAKISQSYVELGKNSALLAVGVDWTVFQQSRYPSRDVVMEEVETFLKQPGQC